MSSVKVSTILYAGLAGSGVSRCGRSLDFNQELWAGYHCRGRHYSFNFECPILTPLL